MRRVRFIFLIFLLITVFCNRQPDDSLDIADAMEQMLTRGFLHHWYPAVIDSEFDGTLNTFTTDWQPAGLQDKWLVPQARHLWTASKAGLRYPDDLRYRQSAETGYQFLKEHLWDKTHGGFYAARDRFGQPENRSGYDDEKRVYGQAFAIYGLAAYYELTGNQKALDLAIKAFQWVEKHGYDAENGGYFEHFDRNGNVLLPTEHHSSAKDSIVFGLKGMNASIHLLEAMTALYEIWPDSLLQVRLTQQLELIHDTILHEDGYMRIFFNPDWTPVCYRDSTEAVRQRHYHLDHISFGHDVETAFLMLEAAHALNLNPAEKTKTLSIARNCVDHALNRGWDEEKGGFYYEGYYAVDDSSMMILTPQKEWWVQAEGINALLLMYRYFPEEERYWHAFLKLWKYIEKNIYDHENGGWYSAGIDSKPEAAGGAKGHGWKASYHDGRAMMQCLDMLKADRQHQ